MLYNKRYFIQNPIGAIKNDLEERTLEVKQAPDFMSYYPLLKLGKDTNDIIRDVVSSCNFRFKNITIL